MATKVKRFRTWYNAENILGPDKNSLLIDLSRVVVVNGRRRSFTDVIFRMFRTVGHPSDWVTCATKTLRGGLELTALVGNTEWVIVGCGICSPELIFYNCDNNCNNDTWGCGYLVYLLKLPIFSLFWRIKGPDCILPAGAGFFYFSFRVKSLMLSRGPIYMLIMDKNVDADLSVFQALRSSPFLWIGSNSTRWVASISWSVTLI